MARIGKIARLPRDIRSQLNSRLQDGAEGKQLLPWLNSLPQVQALLADKFGGRPVNEQNLSDWRQGGYQEWLAQNDILDLASELAAHRQDLAAAAPGQSPSDLLAASLAFRFGAVLASQGPQLDEPSLLQLKSLGRTCQAVVKLRRSDQNAARLKIETERWELERQKILADNEIELKERQRDALAAPIRGIFKSAERAAQYGLRDETSQFALKLLNEIETCPDPANFKSKVLAAESPEKWARLAREMEEREKNPPKVPTPMEAAAEMIRQADAALGFPPGHEAKFHKEMKRRLDRLGASPAKRRPRRRKTPPVKKVQPATPPHPDSAQANRVKLGVPPSGGPEANAADPLQPTAAHPALEASSPPGQFPTQPPCDSPGQIRPNQA